MHVRAKGCTFLALYEYNKRDILFTYFWLAGRSEPWLSCSTDTLRDNV
uniref:Uncharacterized protein n=1 Tax=Arundo donax TaxID=35708 RepID=A0A0A9A8Z7_ARUDO